jgi:putative spermidine/putrescine transport system permease protein
VLLLCVIALFVVFMILPLVVAVTMAFDGRNYMGAFPPTDFSLQWFHKFFGDEFYMKGVRTSFLIAFFTMIISTGVGLAAAVALADRDFPGKDLLAALFLSPLVIPAVVIGFALLLFFSQIGVFDGFIRLLAGHVLITIPYAIRVSLAGLVAIPKSTREAALVLGANEWKAFWTITLPLAKTNVFAAAIFAFIFSMDDVAVSLFLSSVDAYTLPVAMVGMMRSAFDLSVAAGAVFLMVVMTTIMLAADILFGIGKVLTRR